jgi:hypothetical protein
MMHQVSRSRRANPSIDGAPPKKPLNISKKVPLIQHAKRSK